MTSPHATRAFSTLSGLCLALAPLALLLVAAPTGAAAVGAVLHTYEEFAPNGGEVGSFYPGFVYSGDDDVYCAYNSYYFPTATRPCAVVPTGSGVVDIAAEVPVVAFEIDVATGGFGTVTVEGFNDFGFLVARNVCGSASETFVRCGITGLGMRYLRVSGTPDYYVFDTATFVPSGVGDDRPNPAVRVDPEGPCTVDDDRNGNGSVDAGEVFVTTPCAIRASAQALPRLSSPLAAGPGAAPLDASPTAGPK